MLKTENTLYGFIVRVKRLNIIYLTTPSKKKRGKEWLVIMLSLTKCKNILNKNGIKYTEKEIEVLRELLTAIAKLQLAQTNN